MFHGICVDIPTQVSQVRFLYDVNSIVTTLEQSSAMIVSLIVRFGVAVEYALREQSCRRVALLQHEEVVVIWKQIVCDHREVELF